MHTPARTASSLYRAQAKDPAITRRLLSCPLSSDMPRSSKISTDEAHSKGPLTGRELSDGRSNALCLPPRPVAFSPKLYADDGVEGTGGWGNDVVAPLSTVKNNTRFCLITGAVCDSNWAGGPSVSTDGTVVYARPSSLGNWGTPMPRAGRPAEVD